MKIRVTEGDLARMKDQLYFTGSDRRRKLSRYWLLLSLAAVIASAGVIGDSTATVIGAMIVAPLMTPILGAVLAIVSGDGVNLRRSVVLVVLGACSVVAIGAIMGVFIGYDVVAATNAQVAARVSPRLIDLVAALATGAVGAVALNRSDISDTLPGVAISISLVPPLAVVGLTWESGAPHESIGALVLFLTNVCAILASGVVVMWIYGAHRVAVRLEGTSFRRSSAVSVVAALLVIIVIPLSLNSQRIDRTLQHQQVVSALATSWAHGAGWTVLSVTHRDGVYFVIVSGPAPAPSLHGLSATLSANGIAPSDVHIVLSPVTFETLPSS